MQKDDVIYRKQVLDICNGAIDLWHGQLGEGALVAVRDRISELPAAQPEPNEGHWIPHETPDGGEQYECSRCGVLWEFNDGTPEDNEAYFCPKCGAKMKGERRGEMEWKKGFM